ncbi:MAG TPA: YoaK family protein [Rhizomicrobium sp.]
MALAAVAGFVDAYGFIRYGTYLSFMSGNTTQAGYGIGRGDFAAVPLFAAAIVAFLCGSFAGAFYGHPMGRLSRRSILAGIAGAMALVIGLTVAGLSAALPSVGLIGFAMGAMNTALPGVGAQSVNLTFVTGTLRRLGTHLALAARHAPLIDSQGAWDTHRRRALLLAGLWAGFLFGAALGGAATAPAGAYALLAPIVTLLIVAACDRA